MDPTRGYIIPKRLNLFATYSLDELTGRDKILVDIYNTFIEKNIILLSGLGGIGKTTVARAYLEKYRDVYEHLAYVDVSTNIVESLLQRLSNVDKSFTYNILVSPLENLEKLFSLIKTIYNVVLVIDNCNDEDELRTLKPLFESLEWKIILTSRVEPSNYLKETIKVKELNKDESYALFNNFYEVNEDEQETVKFIVEKAHYHTKLIILLAKAARNNPLLNLKSLAINTSKNNYQDDNLNIVVDLNNEERSVYEFILLLYDLDELSSYQKHYMRFFSILPSQEIPISQLYELFEGEKNQQYFINTLNKLVSKGWIEKYNNNFYRIHPLIQLVAREKLAIKLSDISNLINNLDYLFQQSLNQLNLSVYLPYCEAIIKFFESHYEVHKGMGLLFNRISVVYRALAQYDKAIEANLNALKIFTSEDLKFPEAEAQCYGYLQSTYSTIAKHKEAVFYGEKCLSMQKTLLSPSHPDLAVTYNNLSALYHKIEDHGRSYDYIILAINIIKPIYLHDVKDKVALTLINAYTNLANLWAFKARELGERYYLTKALFSEFRALIVAKRFLPEEHPFIATINNNISLTYRDMGYYEKSTTALNRAIQVKKEIFEENHPELAISYYNMSILLEKTGRNEEALSYAIMALKKQEKNFDAGHYNVVASNELINRLNLALDSNK